KPDRPELTPRPSRRAKTPPAPSTLPATVQIPASTRIAVVLDTPLSTRIARQGQAVTFRTSDPLRIANQLEVPPETTITGSVVEVKRPGSFGKSGVLRVMVDRINLSTGTTRDLVAHVDSADLKANGRPSA